MFRIVLLCMAVTGLQALPISRRMTKTHHDLPPGVQDGLTLALPDGPRRTIVDLNTGLVQDYMSEMNQRTDFLSPPLDNVHKEMERRQQFPENSAEEVPVQKNGGGWVRVEGRAAIPDGFRQGTEPSLGIPEGFRQGTERYLPIPNGFRQGTEPSRDLPVGFRQGTEPTDPVQYRQEARSLSVKRINTIPDGFRQGTEPSNRIPDGFRQGTERFMPIPDGFRQGTEPFLSIPAGFRQGTEPSDPVEYREVARSLNLKQVNTIPDGFRQGTEPSNRIPDGFRQGTERFMPIPDGFRQGTEPFLSIPAGFRQGTEPSDPVENRKFAQSLTLDQVNTNPDSFRQDTNPTNPLDHKDVALSSNTVPDVHTNQVPEGFHVGVGPFMPVRDGDRQDAQPSNHIQASFSHVIEPSELRQEYNMAQCKGEIIYGRCYVFNPEPMPFLEAKDSCKSLSPNAELASVASEDLHSRLVSMVMNGGQRDPVMTWLGGTLKNQQGSWLDGSEWRYSDWMPGQPNIHTDKPVCVEMFRMGETWWTAADCDLKRASICSYPVVA